ncbi:MAG TPA: nuclear transport factor 2 family protein [Rubricoccaceae bacterium]|nr:nuclear transport factor 2 family protein [Rubricoccaceae bacterium]
MNNTALVRAIYDNFNARDFDATLALATPDVTLTNVPLGATLHGPEGFRQFLEGWATAFSDAQVEVTNVIDGGDQVVVEFTGRGTHDGPFLTPAGPIPGTGRKVDVHFCDVWTLRDGRVATARTYFDAATLLAQLGVMPSPEAATV